MGAHQNASSHQGKLTGTLPLSLGGKPPASRVPARLPGAHLQGAVKTRWRACSSASAYCWPLGTAGQAGESTPDREAPSSAWQRRNFSHIQLQYRQAGKWVDWRPRGSTVITGTVLKSKHTLLFCSEKFYYIISLIIASLAFFFSLHFSMVFRTSVSQMLGFLV